MWKVAKYTPIECGLIVTEQMFSIPVLKRQITYVFNLVLFLNSDIFDSNFSVKSKAKKHNYNPKLKPRIVNPLRDEKKQIFKSKDANYQLIWKSNK